MKFYYFVIISIGIMLTMFLAGVDGVGTNVRNIFVGNNNTLVQPTTQTNVSFSGISSAVNTIKNSSATSYWLVFLMALLGLATLGAITGISTPLGGTTFDPRRAIFSAIAYFLFGLFVSDMWSVLSFVFGQGEPWVGWFLAVIISVYVAGFAIATLEFTGGTD